MNTVVGLQRQPNVDRDPRVSVAIADPGDPFGYIAVRGGVVASTTEGAADRVHAMG